MRNYELPHLTGKAGRKMANDDVLAMIKSLPQRWVVTNLRGLQGGVDAVRRSIKNVKTVMLGEKVAFTIGEPHVMPAFFASRPRRNGHAKQAKKHKEKAPVAVSK